MTILRPIIKALRKLNKFFFKKRKRRGKLPRNKNASRERKLFLSNHSKKRQRKTIIKGKSRVIKKKLRMQNINKSKIKKRPFISSKKKLIVKNVKSAIRKQQLKEKVVKEIEIGVITHYFSKIEVVVLKMNAGTVSSGDKIHIKGSATDFIQKVASLQIESVDVKQAHKGQLVGLKVVNKAKEGDKVYKLL